VRARNQRYREARSSGISLPALLIAMALGLLFAALLVWSYAEARRQFLLADELARVRENGRFAMALLRRELALAGFHGGLSAHTAAGRPMVVNGCGVAARWPLGDVDALDLQVAYPGGAPQTVTGVVLDCLPAAMLQRGSDLLAIRRTAAEATLADGTWAAAASGVDRGQWYLQIRGPTAAVQWWQAGRVAAAESVPGSGVDYWRLLARVFYVRRYSVVPADRIPTLCAAALAPAGMFSQCLVEGVERFHIELGVDGNGDGVPEHYVSQPDAAQLRRAVTARVALLVRSLVPVPGYTGGRRYRLGQRQFVADDDGYVRRVFSTTVGLRNLRPAVAAGEA
jgi:hypothetical protein